MKFYYALAYACERQRAYATTNQELADFWQERLDNLLAMLPSGSGFNVGTKLVDCTENRMTFSVSFQHMNGHGFYTGWTHHSVIVTAQWIGPKIRITGRNRDGIKGYIMDEFISLLYSEVEFAPASFKPNPEGEPT